MKKILSLLTLLGLSICLLGISLDRIVPASTVNAAPLSPPVSVSAGSSEQQAVSLRLSAQPVAFALTGLECLLFGVIAISPLLIDDPALRRGAGIDLNVK